MTLAGVTQEQLEAQTGVPQGFISAISNGRSPKLPVHTARKFSIFFGCAIEDLFPEVAAAA